MRFLMLLIHFKINPDWKVVWIVRVHFDNNNSSSTKTDYHHFRRIWRHKLFESTMYKCAMKLEYDRSCFRLTFKLDWFIIAMTTKLPIQFISCDCNWKYMRNGRFRSESQSRQNKENTNLAFQQTLEWLKIDISSQNFNKVCIQLTAASFLRN